MTSSHSALVITGRPWLRTSHCFAVKKNRPSSWYVVELVQIMSSVSVVPRKMAREREVQRKSRPRQSVP